MTTTILAPEALANLAMALALPNHAEGDTVQMETTRFRAAVEHAIKLGKASGLTEAKSQLGELVGPLLGCSLAMEGISDSIDGLLQQNQDEGGYMVSEMILSVKARLDRLNDEIEALTHRWEEA